VLRLLVDLHNGCGIYEGVRTRRLSGTVLHHLEQMPFEGEPDSDTLAAVLKTEPDLFAGTGAGPPAAAALFGKRSEAPPT